MLRSEKMGSAHKIYDYVINTVVCKGNIIYNLVEKQTLKDRGKERIKKNALFY